MKTPNQLPEERIPSPEETLDRLLPDDGGRPVDPAGDEVVEGEVVEGEVVDKTPTPEELGLALPDDPDEAQQILLRELAAARAEADEYLDSLRRIAADFENYRRRVERDQAENVARASERVVRALLPALDNFDAALKYEPQSEGEQKVLEGLRGTYQQLMDVLRREGLEPIEALGKPFDPEFHEAAQAPRGEGSGDLVVTQELRKGYTFKGRVIRPALVVVDHAGNDA